MTEMHNNQAFANMRNNPPVAAQPPATVVQDNRIRIEEFGLFEPDFPVNDHHSLSDVITIG